MKKFYTVRYVALSGDVVWMTVEAENEDDACSEAWNTGSNGSSDDILKIIDISEGSN